MMNPDLSYRFGSLIKPKKAKKKKVKNQQPPAPTPAPNPAPPGPTIQPIEAKPVCGIKPINPKYPLPKEFKFTDVEKTFNEISDLTKSGGFITESDVRTYQKHLTEKIRTEKDPKKQQELKNKFAFSEAMWNRSDNKEEMFGEGPGISRNFVENLRIVYADGKMIPEDLTTPFTDSENILIFAKGANLDTSPQNLRRYERKFEEFGEDFEKLWTWMLDQNPEHKAALEQWGQAGERIQTHYEQLRDHGTNLKPITFDNYYEAIGAFLEKYPDGADERTMRQFVRDFFRPPNQRDIYLTQQNIQIHRLPPQR